MECFQAAMFACLEYFCSLTKDLHLIFDSSLIF